MSMKNERITQKYNFEEFFKEYAKLSKKNRIEYCLEYIIEKLRKHSISALVGAGFSLNANLNKTSSESKYKDWAGLLFDAYKELYSKSEAFSISDENEKYDAIKTEIIKKGESAFAQEYVNQHNNRESLDFYIEEQFSRINKDTDNLHLHNDLLSLNWCDVITTNWDDLLERASKNATNSQPFSLVRSAKGLKVGNSSRIIKLNGSLRDSAEKKSKFYRFDDNDDYLYVITSQDFENYRKQHEGFSNFMKVKTLENSLCLFGFSGHDSNFKYWIKELKSTMQKGDVTEFPNPIFLIAPPKRKQKYNDAEEKRIAQLENESDEQFLVNNYIVRINLEEIDNYLRRNFPYGFIYTPIPADVSYLQKTFSMFQNLFKFLKYRQSHVYVKNEISLPEQKNTIRQIALSNSDTLSDTEILSYNSLGLFDFQNLYYSQDFIRRIQLLGNKVSEWEEKEYRFIFRWCMNNFYTLRNLYVEKTIDAIIKRYINSVKIMEQVPEFLELIMRYYNDTERTSEFKGIAEKFREFEPFRDCIAYETAIFFHVRFEYEELKKVLRDWCINRENPLYSLYAIRRVSLLLEYENVRFISDELKDDIEKMFVFALEKSANELQLRYFILLFTKLFLYSVKSPDAARFNYELEELESSATAPRKYIDYFLATENDNKAKPNSDIRYSFSVQIRNSEFADKKYLNIERFFNFLEFTGFSGYGFIKESDLLNLAFEVKDDEYYSVRTLIKSLQFFGNDATEDFLRTIVPRIARFLNQNMLSELLKQIYDIAVYKINHNQNAKVYVFILNELIERVDKDSKKHFLKNCFNLLKKDIESENNYSQILNSVTRGDVWGWGIPFKSFLENIGFMDLDEDDIILLIKWIVGNYIADENDNVSSVFVSEFKKYLFSFATSENNTFVLKKLSANSDFQNIFSQNTLAVNSISLYIFDYLSTSRRQELVQFFEENFTVKTDPYFIEKIKTEKLKEKIISLLESYEMLAEHSGVYSFDSYVKALVNARLLKKEDVKKVIEIIGNKYYKLKSNPNYFKYSFYNSYDSRVSEVFRAFSEIKRIETENSDNQEEVLYEEMKSEYMRQKKELFSLSWLYDDNLQNFKKGFMDMLSVLSYTFMEEKYCYVFDIALSKLILQDSSEFEAVLENFLMAYENGYGNHVFENKHTKAILQEIFNKFNKSIPYCYDDLFMKKQIERLSKILVHRSLN